MTVPDKRAYFKDIRITHAKCELGRKEMFYLTTHSTHFIYGYMASYKIIMVEDHSDSERGNPLPPHRLLFPISSKQWRRKMPKSGGGGAQRHVIYLPSIKNQYKRVVFGYMVIYEQPSVSVY